MSEKDKILKILKDIPDPEIPVLSIVDLGIIKDVQVEGDHITVTVTPTYGACPASEVIRANIKLALAGHGYKPEVNTELTPPWSTDWISDSGKKKLLEYGIAPPGKSKVTVVHLFPESEVVACPQCQSTDTSLISEFGSTPCKSLFRCNACQEPFDYFKCL